MTAEKTWLDPIESLKGIGPKSGENFRQLGIKTIRDLFFHFPFRFDDLQARDLTSILDQEKVALYGQVVSPPVVAYFGHRKSRLTFRIAVDQTQVIGVTFFNQPYLKNQVQLGQQIGLYGKWQEKPQSLLGIKIIRQSDGEDFAPVYHATKGLRQTQIVKAIRQAFDDYSDCIMEVIPSSINQKFKLIPIKEALYGMHFPTQGKRHQQAQAKVIFQEFFLYQWRLQRAKYEGYQQDGLIISYPVKELRRVIECIPFELTVSQKKVINEICRDLLSPFPMNRLLQGDVGSGKTLVAFITMIACVLAGYQTALMVPTELLARQHWQSFNRYFEEIDLHAELLTSEMPSPEKRQIIDGLSTGRIRLVIGTHALIQEGVNFQSLAYLVIDEQHRFGVGQRQALLEKGLHNKGADCDQANVLQMTATPIPRSLAQTLFADLAVSTIDGLPGGRLKIQTYFLTPDQLDQAYARMEVELSQGHQVYYVLPLIEASEHLDQVENVQATVDRLNQIFPQYQIASLHGQLNRDQQKEVMEAFKANQVQILVATTMVEVGVDVGNATVMVIQSAERFGLSQLHQLRGRVGRSTLPSHCFLIGQPTTEQGQERLMKMVESQDGFELSQADLKIRGMGDVLGRNQSGLPNFNYGHPIEDQAVMQAAYACVQDLFQSLDKISPRELDVLNSYYENEKIEI